MKLSLLTSKILAYRELPNFNMDDSIDWAIEMLELGYDTPSLLMLAGISKPTNFLETEYYLLHSLKELDIQIPNREDAILGYCKYYIEKISVNENVRANLTNVHNLAQSALEEPNINSDFYLLAWAWGDFDYEQTYTDYWPEATPETIESIVISKAKEWLIIN